MRFLTGPENDYRALLDAAPDPAAPTVAVVMPVYNRVDLLLRTVAGLAAQSYPHELTKVVVADDGSDEDVAAALEPLRSHLDITLVRREHDGYGAGQARNLGAHAATGADVLVFIDADCLPDHDLVARHAEWHRKADNLVVIGSRHGLDTSAFSLDELVSAKAALRQAAFGTSTPTPDQVQPEDHRRVLHRRTTRLRAGSEGFRSLVSSNFSIRRELFLATGGFSEDFTRWGGEDVELGWRLWNDGAFFVPEDWAICYHQLQEDAWGATGRDESKAENAGIIVTKIPHRFYRRFAQYRIWEVPKVSWVITGPDVDRSDELWKLLLDQRYTDWEAIFPPGHRGVDVLAEGSVADPRFRLAPGGDRADVIRAAKGEYVALLDTRAVPAVDLLGRTVRVLDAKPRLGRISVGYRLMAGDGVEDRLSDADVAAVDEAWGTNGLPVFALARRREWAKALRASADADAAWTLVTEQARGVHVREALVALPSLSPDQPSQRHATTFRTDRSLLASDLRQAPGRGAMLQHLGRYAIQKARRRPYAGHPGGSAAATPTGPRAAPDQPVTVRYVGWTGQDNLGDDAMLRAATQVLPWADVRTKGPGSLLLLGGGTLINRSNYLRWLGEQDSPRIERAVLGTGVANPSYWGEREKPADWIEFLTSCAYVGVRGPVSEQTLRSWGYRGQCEVVGDLALALTVDAAATRHPDRLVVCPATTGDELWGGSDQRVFDALAELVRSQVATGRDVVMLACHPRDDRPILEISRSAGVPDLPYVAGYADIDRALEVLGSATAVVAERLHGAVLAAVMGTPFVGIEYRPKVTDFAASVGLERFVVRSDEVSADRLSGLIRDLEADHGVAADMATRVGEYRGRLAAAAEGLHRTMTT